MEARETGLGILAAKVGAWMFISWTLILGPLGLALYGGLAYAMYFSNQALGVVCVLLLFSPLMFLAIWVPLMGAQVIVERSGAWGTESPPALLTHDSEVS